MDHKASLFFSTFCSAAAAVAAAGVHAAMQAQAAKALTTTFRARATIALCGDYQADPAHTTLELRYRIGADPTLFPVTILSSNIDTAANSGTFDFDLPSTLTTVPIAVSAVCRNTFGLGKLAAEKSLTNCDYLALLDTDGDGIPNSQEDVDCSNQFSPGDLSNPDNVDTDGDGVRDLVERLGGFDPTNPGDSPRPTIFHGESFDPDGDGNSNPAAWRPNVGDWFIQDGGGSGVNMSFPFGKKGDIPFTYRPKTSNSEVGFIRRVNTDYQWFFHGEGFYRSDTNATVPSITFGNFGDNIILGPWEERGVTSPAVARLYNDSWAFFVYLHDGTIRESHWGGNGDIPMPADYDGDGLFDVAVYRPAAQRLYVIFSSNGSTTTIHFGSGTAEYNFRGDITGDGKDDITFWEPATGEFSSLLSRPGLPGFNETLGNQHDPLYYLESQLGLYQTHVPLPWNKRNGKVLYTVIDHVNGNRYFRAGNDPDAPVSVESWGLQGDSLG